MSIEEKLVKKLDEAVYIIQQLKNEENRAFIQQSALLIAQAFLDKKKVIIAGNGGSMCDANHFAEELTGFFDKKRRALPAISLSESGHLTCVANDIGYDYVFSRGVEAFGQPGDVFIGLSTSGNSKNIFLAVQQAKMLGLHTITLLGKTGGTLKGVADLELFISQSNRSDRVQEAHMTALHLIIDIVEMHLLEAGLFSQQEVT